MQQKLKSGTKEQEEIQKLCEDINVLKSDLDKLQSNYSSRENGQKWLNSESVRTRLESHQDLINELKTELHYQVKLLTNSLTSDCMKTNTNHRCNVTLTPGDTAGEDDPGPGHGEGPDGHVEGAGPLQHQVHHGHRGHQVQGHPAGEGQEHVGHQHGQPGQRPDDPGHVCDQHRQCGQLCRKHLPGKQPTG